MSEEPSNPQCDNDAVLLDPAVTPHLFREWRSPRFGQSNPERMNNPVWEWLVRSKVSAYSANQQLGGPSAFGAGPGWCFARLGQTTTQLADGRIVLIAGEHEDFYDTDFCIYNDVIVVHADGQIDILGYPREVFPPTDFHTATLVGNRIIVIGNLGYIDDRQPGTTQVVTLDLDTFAINSVQTSGTPPGWLHKHVAQLSDDGASILIQHGKLERGGVDESHVENIDDWLLHLADWRWERLTERQWQRWEIIREDRKANHLWYYEQASWDRVRRWDKQFQKELENLSKELGIQPDVDLFLRLYQPAVPHEPLAEIEGEYRVFRIRIDETTVRYVEDMYSIQVTVEGDLPQPLIDELTADLLNKMNKLENASHELKKL